ncbi:fibronectin type III domain-containing protein [Ancylothrix sp. C2]|uniref:fibronectin type III domain-containing protein n=1 Tax=Ancylothrix sp. D3o TaxID=2953691 RepID=UPI0021BB90DC|nr:fibronectin type III domain-containing protein [Ancylothrix sp. D3o]MCT7951004.1 fibronectin type III domain-containing protein [Ancylothrix sp. D3o]
MKRTFSLAIYLSLILCTVTHSSRPNPVIAQPIKPAFSATGGLQLIEVSGEVFLHRVGEESIRRLNLNSEILPGDLLIVRRGAKATIRCPNGQKWPLPEGVSGAINGCRMGSTGDPRLPVPRTLVSENNPFIISPRQTALLNDRLVLRWNPVAGVKTYTVKLRDSAGLKWETEVSENQIIYNGSPLQPGERYTLSVRAESPTTSENESTIFWLLDEKTDQAVREKIAAVDRQALPSDAKALAKANIYSKYRLFAAAIEVLETSAAGGNSTASFSQMLSALYEQVGLNSGFVARR